MFHPRFRPLIQTRALSLKSLKPDISRFRLIEQPVGHIVGTVNEAVPQMDVDYFHGSYHWSYERLLAVTMIPLTITPFVASVDLPIVDSLLATSILLHSHIGFQSCIIDYIPKRVYGIWHKIAMWLLTLGSGVGMYGVYLIETTDEGLSNLIGGLWTEPEPKPLVFGHRY